MEKISDIRNLIQGEIKRVYGQEILYAKDCQFLSATIFQKTKRSVSASTLKRLFGIIASPYLPSGYTLDSVSLYLNYRNWSDMKEKCRLEQDRVPGIDHWAKLKSRIEIITNRSLASIKAKLQDQLSDFKPREFATRKLEDFLSSPCTATAFIAPGGYGKTTITTQLTEQFFTGPGARCPGDIVCLIDGSILLNLMNLNLEFVRVKNILNFEDSRSFSTYFIKHPEQVKGRFVLIIESLYQIYHQEEKLKNFLANLMDILSYYKDIPWFKCIVTCRPDNWKILSNHIQNRPELRDCWYGVTFQGSTADYINVPLLDAAEIDYFLKRKRSGKNFRALKFLYPDMEEILVNPYLLNLFVSIESPGKIHSDLEILEHYFSEKVFVEPYLEEKYAIIEAFIKLSGYGEKSYSLKKSDLPLSGSYQHAYEALIFNNVVYDYSVTGRYLSVDTFVRFSNDILLGYCLANAWIKENPFNLELVKKIYSYYDSNPALRTIVLKYMVKIAFREKNMALLSGMLPVLFPGRVPVDAMQMDHRTRELCSTIGLELRKDKETRDALVPHYARGRIGQKIFFESFFDMDSLVLHSGNYIDHYLGYKRTGEARHYGHFIKYMHFFLQEDRENCTIIHDALLSEKLNKDESPAGTGYYLSTRVIHRAAVGKLTDELLIREIHSASDRFYAARPPGGPYTPIFEHILIVALHYGNNSREIIELFERTQKRCEGSKALQSWQAGLCRMIYAWSLLDTGRTGEANQVFGGDLPGPVPYNCKHYVAILTLFIRIGFLVCEKRTGDARALLKEIKSVSQLLKFRYFYMKATRLELSLG